MIIKNRKLLVKLIYKWLFYFGWAGRILSHCSRIPSECPPEISAHLRCLSFRGSNPLNKIKKPQLTLKLFYFGWAGRIRTAEMPESKSGALPLGYSPILNLSIWGERWDSNPRPPGPQPGALTN